MRTAKRKTPTCGHIITPDMPQNVYNNMCIRILLYYVTWRYKNLSTPTDPDHFVRMIVSIFDVCSSLRERFDKTLKSRCTH